MYKSEFDPCYFFKEVDGERALMSCSMLMMVMCLAELALACACMRVRVRLCGDSSLVEGGVSGLIDSSTRVIP